MKRRGAALSVTAVLTVLGYGAALAQSQNADVNSYIAKAPVAGLPPGAYSQWTEAQRKTAFGRLSGFCQYLCVDKYSGASFPNKQAAGRAMIEAKVCLGACIVNHLPADYPGLPGLTQQLHADYDKAKQLGSPVPWPLPGK